MALVFNDLTPLTRKPTVRVMCIRCYGVLTRDGTLNSFECIFYDVEGVRFHFTAGRSVASLFHRIIQEGVVYTITHFGIVHNSDRFRLTEHRFKGHFFANTAVIREAEPEFPRHMFCFKPFAEILSMENVAESAPIDIIGRVVSTNPPSNVNTRDGKQKIVREMVLEDNDGLTLGCSLWDEYADLFNHRFGVGNGEIILVMQFCRPSLYQGKVRVQNGFRVTKLYVNPDIPEVKEFREISFGNMDNTSRSSFHTVDDDISTNSITVSDIKSVCTNEAVGTFTFPATVVNVDEPAGWFYYSCNRCTRKMDQLSNRCRHCNHTTDSPIMKYKISIFVADNSSSTSMVLWDKDCINLFEKTASDLKSSLPEEVEDFPLQILSTLLDKTFTFTVTVREADSLKFGRQLNVASMTPYDGTEIPHLGSTEVGGNAETPAEQVTEKVDSVECENDTPNMVISVDDPEKTGEEFTDITKNLMDEFSTSKPGKRARLVKPKIEK